MQSWTEKKYNTSRVSIEYQNIGGQKFFFRQTFLPLIEYVVRSCVVIVDVVVDDVVVVDVVVVVEVEKQSVKN